MTSQSDETAAVIETRTSVCSVDKSGIVRAINKPNCGIETLEDAIANIKAMETIQHGRCGALFSDYRSVQGQTRECQAYYAGPETAKVVKACAILIENPLSRLLANFYLGLRKPMIPTQLFTSEADAYRWLRVFIG